MTQKTQIIYQILVFSNVKKSKFFHQKRPTDRDHLIIMYGIKCIQNFKVLKHNDMFLLFVINIMNNL